MRILENNAVLSAINIVEMPFYQRLFFSANTLIVGDVVTGGTSLVTGGIVVFVGPNWVDIKLPDDTNFYHPNTAVSTTETLTAASGNTLTSAADTLTTISGRPQLLHPEFPIANIKDSNRNMVIPSKSYLDNLERNFDTLRITSVLSSVSSISCIALVNHNLSTTAVLTINLYNAGTLVFSTSITNPNVIKSDISSYRTSSTGTTSATIKDLDNIPIMYLPTSYLADSVSITIEDYATTEKYLYIGILYAGNYWQPNTDIAYGWSRTEVDTSSTIYAQSPYSVERPKYSLYNISMKNLTPTEASDWQYIFSKNGIHTDVLIDLLHYSTNVEERATHVYGRFGVNNVQAVNDYFDRYSVAIQIRESI